MRSARRHESRCRARSGLYAGIIWLAILAEGKHAGEGGDYSSANNEHSSERAEAEAKLIERRAGCLPLRGTARACHRPDGGLRIHVARGRLPRRTDHRQWLGWLVGPVRLIGSSPACPARIIQVGLEWFLRIAHVRIHTYVFACFRCYRAGPSAGRCIDATYGASAAAESIRMRRANTRDKLGELLEVC